MKRYSNSKKDAFLKSIPTSSLDQKQNNITERMKFNFSYFDISQHLSKDITNLSEDESKKLFKKLLEFSRQGLAYWQTQKIGNGKHRQNVFENYGDFPLHSKFSHPKSVPHQVEWGRFRLESDYRLIGFVVPYDYHDRVHQHTGRRFDRNTFYIVFLDPEHNFYPTKKK